MALSDEVWVITGASKGIGAALVSQVLINQRSVVYACARSPSASTALEECKRQYGARLHLVKLDVTDTSSIQAAAKEVMASESKVDVLVNNAAIIESSNIQTHDMGFKEFTEVIGTNVIGTHCVTQAFYTLIQRSEIKKIVNISSNAGSITTWAALVQGEKNSPLQGFRNMQAAYRASKAALNSVTISWALELSPDAGYKVIALHPGLVSSDTVIEIFRQLNIELDDLASAMEVLTPEGSAKKILGIIQRLEEGDSGKFMDQNGNAVPF